jgi:hypothetical protein
MNRGGARPEFFALVRYAQRIPENGAPESPAFEHTTSHPPYNRER